MVLCQLLPFIADLRSNFEPYFISAHDNKLDCVRSAYAVGLYFKPFESVSCAFYVSGRFKDRLGTYDKNDNIFGINMQF
jgi:hypothetical protein